MRAERGSRDGAGPAAPVLLYALGGGLGHFSRAVALGRALARRGLRSYALVNSDLLGDTWADEAAVPWGAIERIDGDRARIADAVRARLLSGPWSALVIDTFPRGLVGELAPLLSSLAMPRFWVHRDLSPSYVRRFDLRELACGFDRVIVPGEEASPLADVDGAVRTAPWLVRDLDELVPVAAARARLAVPADARPLVVVSASGRVEEIPVLRGLASRLRVALAGHAHVRLVSPLAREPEREIRHWPLIELLRGVDVLVGSGGYNTVAEARATATPLVAIPRRRLYDRQALRLRPEEHAANEEDAIRMVGELLDQGDRHGRDRAERPRARNGAARAAELVEAAVLGAHLAARSRAPTFRARDNLR